MLLKSGIWLSEYRQVNIVWNNSFREIFNCCWHESASSLQFYCGCLPLSHLTTDQQTLVFYKHLYRSDNYILCTLLGLKKHSVAAVLSKYSIHSIHSSVHKIKYYIWETFVEVGQRWSFSVFFLVIFMYIIFFLSLSLICCAVLYFMFLEYG